LRTIFIFLVGLLIGIIFGYALAIRIDSELLLLDWSTVLMVVSTVVMAIFTAGVWQIEFSKFKRIYNPKLRVHTYPAIQDVYSKHGILDTPCLRFRMVLVNPGGVPISLMNDKVFLVKANSGEKIDTQSEFIPPETRPERLYVSQFPWVIKDFCIYEKAVFPEKTELRNTFVDEDWEVHVNLEYEVKPGKVEHIKKKIPWQALQNHSQSQSLSSRSKRASRKASER